MDTKTLKAEVRKIEGRKVKTLRSEGVVPANIFGKKVKSQSVQVSLKEFEAIYKEVGETGVISLAIGSEKRPVLVHNVQLNPKTDEILHVDFHQVDLKEKIEADVPVELIGESPAEKQSLGTVVQYINEVKVEALPADLPEKFVIDISDLSEVDQAVFVKDLKIDRSKVEVKNDPEEIVVKVEPPQKEEVVEVPTPAEGEVPEEGAVPAEGETPAEGQAPTAGSDTPEKPEKPE
jgi:large subunit ribosomal protein L25